jgi:hypothetical protein
MLVLAGGLAYYYKDRDLNALDWEYNYDWPSFETKLTGKGYSLDSNYFDTNFIAHPVAGTLYYWGPRSNRLGPLESLALSFAASAVWEYLAEFRERVSLNDLIVTPLSGAAFGEATIQLGALFDRACDTASNRWVGTLLGPFKSFNDAVDGAELDRAVRCDPGGFANSGEQRLGLSLGAAVVRPSSSLDGSHLVGELRASSEVINLRRYGRPGHDWTRFSDGNISQLELQLSTTPTILNDIRLAARSFFAGVHHRELVLGPRARAQGTEVLAGAGFGIEYSRHRYGGLDERLDPYFVLEVPALFARWRKLSGAREIEATLVVAPTFGGAGGFARDVYLAENQRADLTTVAQLHGYNHAMGVALAPSLTWATAGRTLGVQARVDRFFGLTALDAGARSASAGSIVEARRRARAWLEIGPRRGLIWRLEMAASDRSGRLATARRHRSEIRLGTAVETRF